METRSPTSAECFPLTKGVEDSELHAYTDILAKSKWFLFPGGIGENESMPRKRFKGETVIVLENAGNRRESICGQGFLRVALVRINVAPYSRGGWSRGLKEVKAADRDMMAKDKLVFGGILEPAGGKAFLFFTESNKTSDFIADGINLWLSANFNGKIVIAVFFIAMQCAAANRLMMSLSRRTHCYSAPYHPVATGLRLPQAALTKAQKIA